VSNEAGMIEIGGIERGRYYIRHNLLDAPFSGRRVPVVVDVPSAEVDIEVEALCGVLFSVAGDEVLLTKNLEIGRGAQMHSERSAKEACLRALWANRLRAKWPGATCYVGVPASTTQAAGRVSLEVFGRFSGWNEFEMPLQRVSDVVEPTALAARLVGERAGSMVVTLVQADGGEVDLPGGLASISYESPSGLASFVAMTRCARVRSHAPISHHRENATRSAFRSVSQQWSRLASSGCSHQVSFRTTSFRRRLVK
jgi:hypothetical protein